MQPNLRGFIMGFPVQEELQLLSDLGLGGIAIVALYVLLRSMIKDQKTEREAHREERMEWIAAYKAGNELTNQRQLETTQVLRDLTEVIRESNTSHRVSDHPGNQFNRGNGIGR